MNPGVAQGFVRFDSQACRILRALHENGPMTGAELKRNASRSETVQISATLIRLQKAGMVFRVGRHRPDGKRSHPLFHIHPVNNRIGPRVLTGAEKARLYRERRKVKVPSVFEFRGRISI